MSDLLEAIKIFLKYGNPHCPTDCKHDIMYVDINPELVSKEDILLLEGFGFFVDDDDECFYSYRFGRC